MRLAQDFVMLCYPGGPVPQLSDTDPEQYNPLHQLDELADGDSCKKQRVQPSLLQQVVSILTAVDVAQRNF